MTITRASGNTTPRCRLSDNVVVVNASLILFTILPLSPFQSLTNRSQK
jgi:hypothetical protein